MKQILLLAGAAALAAAAPAFAKPDHAKGKGKSHHDQSQHWDGDSDRGYWGYGTGGCPPGLAKKNSRCMPPGQYKKLYGVGERWRSGYGYRWSYNQIPYDMRTRYGWDQRSNYYYGDGYIYRVDPRTLLVAEVVNAILR
jgi:opacity protein-like surface antigen